MKLTSGERAEMTQELELPALPRPDLEDVDYELWGQNVKSDCWFEKKMRAYATAAVLAERERCADIVASAADRFITWQQADQLIAAIRTPPAKKLPK